MNGSNLVRWALGLCLALSVLWLGAGVSTAAGGYHLLKKIPLGASPGGGEYFVYITVDGAARRVYLSHGTEFKVLDADTFAVAGTITGGFKRNHGAALVPELGKGFISDGELAEAVMFDMKTMKVLSHIPTQKDCDSIFYDPVSKHVFTFNGSSKNSTVIDPVKGTVIATIPLGGAPEQAALLLNSAL